MEDPLDKLRNKVIILALLVVVVCTVFGVWWWERRRDTRPVVAEGDRLMQEGKFLAAADRYASAIRRAPDDLSTLKRFVDAVRRAPALPLVDGAVLSEAQLEAQQRILILEPANTRVETEWFEAVYACVQAYPSQRLIDLLYLQALRQLTEVSLGKQQSDDPLARKYRALAEVERLKQSRMDRNAQPVVSDDLQAAERAFADDEALICAKAMWHWLFRSQSADQAKPEERQARDPFKILDAYLVRHPHSLPVQLMRIRLWLGEGKIAPAAAAMATLETELLATDDAVNTRELAALVVLSEGRVFPKQESPSTRALLHRAEVLLRHVTSHHPKDAPATVALAENLRLQGQMEEASRLLEEFLAPGRPYALGLETLLAGELHAPAINNLASTYLDWAATTSGEPQAMHLAKADACTRSLPSLPSTPAAVAFLEGKAALVRGLYDVASVRLDQADRLYEGRNFEASYLAAKALYLAGETGAALARFTALRGVPNGWQYAEVDLDVAAIQVRLNEPDAALQSTAQVLAKLPAAPRARVVQAQALIAQERWLAAREDRNGVARNRAAAQALIAQISPQDRARPEVSRALAEYYASAGLPNPDAGTRPSSPAAAKRAGAQAAFQKALDSKDMKAALALADDAARENWDGCGGVSWLGRVTEAQGHLEDAEKAYEKAVRLRPPFSDAWFRLGGVRERLGKPRPAQEAYAESLRLRPDRLEAWRARLRLLRTASASTLPEVMKSVQTAMRLFPEDLEVFQAYLFVLAQQGQEAEVIGLRRELAQRNPTDQENLRALAGLCLRQGRNDEARAILEKLLAAPDGTVLANVAALAELERRTGQARAGRERLEAFVRKRGDKAGTGEWLTLARYLGASDDVPAAVAAFQKAMELEPDGGQHARQEMADWYFGRRDFGTSYTLYQQAFEKSNNPRFRFQAIQSLWLAGKTKEAAAELKQYFQNFGRDFWSCLLEGIIALAEGRFAVAEKSLDQAGAMDPENYLVHFYRGRFYMAAPSPDKREKAGAALLRAQELNPGSLEVRETLVDWYLLPEIGDVPKAVTELEKMVAQFPDHLPGYVRLANLYLRNKDLGSLGRLLATGTKRFPNVHSWSVLQAELALSGGTPGPAGAELRRLLAEQKEVGMAAVVANALLAAGAHADVLQALGTAATWVAQSPVLSALRARALAMAGQPAEAAPQLAAALEKCLTTAPAFLPDVLEQARQWPDPAAAWALLQPLATRDASGATVRTMIAVAVTMGAPEKVLPEIEKVLQRKDLTQDVRIGLRRELGDLQYRRKQPLAAKAAYLALLQDNPDDALALNNLAGVVGIDLNQPQEGIRYIQRALALVPAESRFQASFLDTLGVIQFRLGQLEPAEQSLRRSALLDPQPITRLHLAEVLATGGKSVKAREQLNAVRPTAAATGLVSEVARVEGLIRKAEKSAAAPRPVPASD